MRALLATVLSVFSAHAQALSPGHPAPLFKAKNQDGKIISLEDFKGKPVILYFYPKDDTPGCTKEACSFRDQYSEIKKHGAVVLGVSTQSAKSHQEFRSKYNLPFDLLIDEDGSLSKAFGVKKMPLIGLLKRQSVLIGKDGRIIKFYENVDPATHVSEVLKDMSGSAK